jgi:Ino eighty subunit 1
MHYFAEAWHVITTTDPLLDSDDEVGDENVRHDCSKFFVFHIPPPILICVTVQRLRVVTALRHKEPTPELERRPITSTRYRTPEYAR